MSPSGPVVSTLTESAGERHREDVLVARLGSLQDPPEHAALRRVDPRVRGVVLILQRHELDLLRGWDRRGGWMRGGRRMTTVDGKRPKSGGGCRDEG